ncbi:MAG TPA: hypothetical protein VFR85_10630 [Anaeromyxobacteraceae bacterium]|nr:hypothetical protein [Anaeromyxobacteraceae bacterium]
MPVRHLSIASLLAVLLASAPAGARGEPCVGTLSGAVQGTFDCQVTLGKGGDGAIVFAVTAASSPAGIRSFAPGTLTFRGPLKVQSYSWRDMTQGKASLSTAGGAVFSAATGQGGKGEAQLTVDEAERYAQLRGRHVVKGSYRARLVPEQGSKGGEVVVDVDFTVTSDVLD